MLFAAMVEELVVIVEARSAEPAEGMAFETSLVDCARLVVTVSHVLLKFLIGEEFVLVGEKLLVAGTQIAHLPLVSRPNMSVQVWPAQAGEDTIVGWAVISEQHYSIANDFFVCISNTDVTVETRDVGVGIFFVSLVCVFGEDYKGRGCLSSSQLP